MTDTMTVDELRAELKVWKHAAQQLDRVLTEAKQLISDMDVLALEHFPWELQVRIAEFQLKNPI